jgi:hypothetical protein
VSDATPDIVTQKKRRGPQPRRRIDLPDGDYLEPRSEFAAGLGVVDRTAARMNLPTTYIGGVAYVRHQKSLNDVAARVQRRNQPPRHRRSTNPSGASPWSSGCA